VKFRFKTRKASSIYVSVLAGLAFLYLVVTRFNFPVEKVLEFLWICFVLVVAIIVVAAPLALLIRWWSNRRDRD
jgi:hypothetical protein